MTNFIPLNSANVLITGGSDGIGRGLAARFLVSGARVLVTGRSKEKLDHAASELPELETVINDISVPAERERLVRHIQDVMPGLSILINNAGIQRRVSLAADTSPWSERQIEIDTLFSGPIHLNHLLVPVILAHGHPASSRTSHLAAPISPNPLLRSTALARPRCTATPLTCASRLPAPLVGWSRSSRRPSAPLSQNPAQRMARPLTISATRSS